MFTFSYKVISLKNTQGMTQQIENRPYDDPDLRTDNFASREDVLSRAKLYI